MKNGDSVKAIRVVRGKTETSRVKITNLIQDGNIIKIETSIPLDCVGIDMLVFESEKRIQE